MFEVIFEEGFVGSLGVDTGISFCSSFFSHVGCSRGCMIGAGWFIICDVVSVGVGNGAEYPPPPLVLPQCVTNVASVEVEVLFAASVVLI